MTVRKALISYCLDVFENNYVGHTPLYSEEACVKVSDIYDRLRNWETINILEDMDILYSLLSPHRYDKDERWAAVEDLYFRLAEFYLV